MATLEPPKILMHNIPCFFANHMRPQHHNKSSLELIPLPTAILSLMQTKSFVSINRTLSNPKLKEELEQFMRRRLSDG